MTHRFALGPRRAGVVAATVTSLAVAGIAGGTSYANAGSGAGKAGGTTHGSPRASGGKAVHDAYVDVTDQGSQAVTRSLKAAAQVARKPAARAALAQAPDGTVLEISGSTHTVRFLGNLDGYLTGRSTRSARHIALGYVRQHLAMLGLSAADLTTFHLQRTYRDITGTRHLFFTQHIAGRPASRNGLTASVGRTGHLLTLGGMPITTSAAASLPPASADTITSAAQALARTRGPEAPGASTGGDTATRVVFDTGNGLRPAWETVVTSSQTPATTVIDAVTGQVLQRTPLTQYEDATGRAYRFFPGAPRGGHQVKVDFTKKGWLGPRARDLSGNNAHAFSDVNDNNSAAKSEEVPPLKGHSWGYRLKPFHLRWARSFCSNPWPCSWNPDKPYSWKVNRAQNTTQVFYYVNNWHDHLLKAPIGFTPAAGNFQMSNHGKGGKGGDALKAETDDGANSGTKAEGLKGLPDPSHTDNAFMVTPPDGRHPSMHMFLQHNPFTSYPKGDPFSPTNVGDEADTVYHEYTHGLSNRLNVDVRGHSTLGGVQAGAMGEAWSDWYAMDYLVGHHLQRDRKGKVDVRLFKYDGAGVALDRTEPMDCKVGSTAKLCKGGTTGHRGGYTYADYGNVQGGPEVHADGEIWGQTLWDLRDRLGSHRTESLVTRAMELAPYNPSFVDMRNAILIADNAVFGGRDRHRIWKVFAHRGMGFYAGSLDGNDTSPAASFAMPPRTIDTGSIHGRVTDFDSGDPVQGLTVTLAFQGSGVVNPTTTTDANGDYTLTGIPAGHYAKLQVRGHGYQSAKPVDVTGGSSTTVNFSPRLDYAGPGSGTIVTDADGTDYSDIGCGPDQAIDGSQSSGWSSNADDPSTQTPTFQPKHLTIKLGQAIDVKQFGVDPSSTCGDDPSSSTAGYQIETSTDGSTWSTAASGTFTRTDVGTLVPVDATVADVRFVRFTIKSDQVPNFATSCVNGGLSGCDFVDLSELEVFGTPSP